MRRLSIFPLALLLALTPPGFADDNAPPPPEAFDGSFRLDTGEVVTGGYFVEAGQGRYLYMDTARLDRGGLFERTGATKLRSLGMLDEDRVEVELFASAEGSFDRLEWREPGRAPISGQRVFPHETQDVTFTSADKTVLSGRLLVPQCEGPRYADGFFGYVAEWMTARGFADSGCWGLGS